MKKTLLFLCFALCFVVLFTSCLEPGDSDDTFSPPGWIRGTWADTSLYHVYVFTAHTVTLRSAYSIANISTIYADDDVLETITDSLYQFEINPDSVLWVTYRYELLAADTLNFTRITAAGTVGPIELVKE